MSTKRIERTIIEGGKAKEFGLTRRASEKRHRAKSKLFCKGLIENEPSSYKRGHILSLQKNEAYADKLKPLARMVGKMRNKYTYEKAYSYLSRKVSRKSMKGWHFFDHFNRIHTIGWDYKNVLGIKRVEAVW